MKITTAQIKYIQSLQQKKFRDAHGVFLAEGEKIVIELLDSDFQIEMLCALPAWFDKHKSRIPESLACCELSPKDLDRISKLRTPNQVLAVVKKPARALHMIKFEQDIVLMLDKLQDPGNLGTIIRTADWFGIRHIICSPDTADIYNPKVIQATMGSFIRVKVHYAALPDVLKDLPEDFPVYGAFLDGTNLFKTSISLPAVLIIGNESQGISQEVASLINRKVMIPGGETGRDSGSEARAESLNAAMAAGIMMAYFRHPAV
jgi:RNA methyltransferase, TrmH family